MKLLKKRAASPCAESFGKVEKKLTEVKIDGDKASGAVVVTRTVEQKKTVRQYPVKFAKVDGGWRIDEEGAEKEVKDKK